ncbi:papilin-like [Dysidea avara]|uniref:papilin-like n=1 Tax=Dysidea avara TaxID=196820 RepID=UPI00331A0320
MDCCKQLFILIALISVANMILGSKWTPCSRTCGVGIMQRTIPCQKGECDGTREEFKACNVKRCPDGNADFRSQQCKTHGEELTPFINKSDPCKLLCSAPGKSPVQKDLVAIDGTPCPSSGVCVAGECVPFGCDHVLGSKKIINKCGTCSDLCVQLPCKFKEIISNDYHTTLPSESTNISIALGSSSCSFKAISNSTKSLHFRRDQSVISLSGTVFMISNNELTAEGPLQSPVTIEVHCPKSSHKMECDYHMSVHIPYELEISSYYEWAVGDNYTPCSQTCGRGIQMPEIYCRTAGTKIRAPDIECSDQSKEGLPYNLIFCDQPACPSEWTHSDWTHCSQSCGGGDRMRDVRCVQVIRDGVQPIQTPGKCDSETKPASLHECNKHPCHNHWHAGDWSICSVDCGEGIQSRNVTCRDANGNKIRRHNCSLQAKPRIERSCTGDICIHKWIKSNWTKCSVSCGEGVQTRQVNCTENGTVVDDSVCLENIPNAKPTEVKSCQGRCCNGIWTVTNWLTECVAPGCHKEGAQSRNCDAIECHERGVQYRNVYCIHNGRTSEENDHIKCNPATEPLNTQGCYRTQGCEPAWIETDWTQCSKPCHGTQERNITCKLGNETLMNERCPNKKPSIKRTCNSNCTVSDICFKEFCYRDDLPQCHQNCCDSCEEAFPQLTGLLRYNRCEKQCCIGELIIGSNDGTFCT